ncbi:ParB N-terminal domain-containing protein [Chryseolinea lacunae]|uniref:ParB N-terminal domain-containing protein n=1 Tax=Chryseolinea lacunae TaxID=2801331 RepID=A0ABS1KNZ3_9BACT|nr:ParB N-terminal domain-containing protein [Chryseolinea lacunae]MBL0741064.1 ParB N-terminal domain-containing protein [Chryseolinea lacunae]
MVRLDQTITIVKELREYIIPLNDEELSLLQTSLLHEGCREPLIVWEKDGQLILVDGHNRYKICQKNGIAFKIRKMPFQNMEEAKVWMIDNQMGRRNLTNDQMSYYRGLRYNSLKQKKGGYANVASKGQKDISTSGKVSKSFNISESTIKRDAKFAEGLDIVGQSNPMLKTKILLGEAKVKKGDVQALASARNPGRLTIKNEKDLYNKAKIIKQEVLQQVEKGLKDLGKRKNNDDEDNREPLFLEKGDKLRRLKGMILSSINKAINDKDIKAMRELKKLVEKLEGELF